MPRPPAGSQGVPPRPIRRFFRQTLRLLHRRLIRRIQGWEVHLTAHIHLVPMQSESDMDFRKEKLQFSPEEMQTLADKVYAAFKAL